MVISNVYGLGGKIMIANDRTQVLIGKSAGLYESMYEIMFKLEHNANEDLLDTALIQARALFDTLAELSSLDVEV